VFAVAGYRMGERALRELGQTRGSFALDVTHRTPFKVQYSCIAGGWQAATGVSAGKLNLHLVEVPSNKMEAEIKDRRSGQEVIFRLRPAFLTTYLNLPQDKQATAARRVAVMPDDEIFTFETVKTAKKE
jgi:formylmethanofuran dehydrogenase subunit E